MRFLVVDPNLAFGWTIRDFLQRHMTNVTVDLARNAPVLERRLQEYQYDLVMADILNAVDREEISKILERLTVPLIMWSIVNPGGYNEFTQNLHARLISKPCHPEELDSLLDLVGCQHEQAKVPQSSPAQEGRAGESALPTLQ